MAKTSDVIENNNRQYSVNQYLIKTTNSLLDNYNKILADSNKDNTLSHAQTLFNKLGLIKEEIAQIVIASQLAKRGRYFEYPITNEYTSLQKWAWSFAIRGTLNGYKGLKFKNVLISQKEKYGIVGKCLEIDDVTICKQN